jgi:multicomponent Na+:H+ antiporter subunit D
MIETVSALPGWALLPAAAAVPLIVFWRRRPILRDAASVTAAAAQTALVAAMVPPALAGGALVWRPLSLVAGIPLLLRADPFGVLFALIASALWLVTTVYSIGYTRALQEPAQTRYFAAFALSLFATVGVALAGNLLTFFVFYELLTIATYPLVIHRGSPEAMRAGRLYLAYTLAGGAVLLGAVAWTHVLAGRTEFQPGGILAGSAGVAPLQVLFGLFVLGLGVKAAVVPLHSWLPVAMVAPTPVSALLHAVAVVKAGVFGLVRVVGFVFGPSLTRDVGAGTALAILAEVTILVGSLAALAQDNLKRLLAFSTVSQLSYILLGIALGTQDSTLGGVLHLASHAVLKISLFFCAGAVYATAHLERVSELDGIGRRMPVTMGAFALSALMLTGLPPGVAFLSKWRLLSGAAEVQAWPAVAVLLASAVLGIGYFAPILLRAFAGPTAGPVGEARLALLVPIVVTTGAGLLLGLMPDAVLPLLSLAQAVVAGVGEPR